MMKLNFAFRPKRESEEKDFIFNVRSVYRGWLDLVMVSLNLNGKDEERQIIKHPSGAAVLAYDPQRKTAIVVQQTRTAALLLNLPLLTEAIAGAIEHEDPFACARQEAMEEAGLKLSDLLHVGRVIMNPSTSTERVDLFLAEYGVEDRIGEGGGLEEENERIVVHEIALDALWTEVVNACPADAKTLLLVQALRLRRPDLFSEAKSSRLSLAGDGGDWNRLAVLP